MYLKYWGLQETPFENRLDPKYLYLSKGHQEALARLQFVVEHQKQIGMLTGEYGTGKTLIAHQIWREMHPQKAQVCYVGNPFLPLDNILRFIVQTLAEGIDQLPSDKAGLLNLFQEIMKRNHQIGRHTVIIFDDAQLVQDIKIFEELRVLLNASFSNEYFLTVILLGQTELHEKIAALPQLKQRVSFHYHLKPLQKDELEGYLTHRLRMAGGPDAAVIFAPDAIDAMYEISRGFPRVINTLSEAALLNAMAANLKQVDKATVQEARQEILA